MLKSSSGADLMNRRSFLTTAVAVGAAGTAGCGALRSTQALDDPKVWSSSPQRQSLIFSANGSALASFGVDGGVDGSVVRLATELSHQEGTDVTGLRLRLWMPDNPSNTPADIAVISPVEGDSSPPPSLALYSPQRARGTVVEVSGFDDLADETISTIDLLVRPRSDEGRTVSIDVSISLAEGGAFRTDYDLSGRLDLEFPSLARA